MDAPHEDHVQYTDQPAPVNRRHLLSHAGAALLGAGLLAGGEALPGAVESGGHLPFYGGYASAIHNDRRTPPRSGRVEVVWGVDTSRKLIALTFDDGPSPTWTPRVLSILEETGTPATFFMVGTRARTHATLVAGRLARHEVGNHTWAHLDLARMTYEQTYRAIHLAHQQLTALCGREPVLLRPPYGHLGGSTLLAAADLGYRVVLWNRQMVESEYRQHPAGLVDYIVNSCLPGTILLAHDTGARDRLVAINGLAEMISGLRAKGYEFLTVSDLLAAGDGGAAPPGHGSLAPQQVHASR